MCTLIPSKSYSHASLSCPCLDIETRAAANALALPLFFQSCQGNTVTYVLLCFTPTELRLISWRLYGVINLLFNQAVAISNL